MQKQKLKLKLKKKDEKEIITKEFFKQILISLLIKLKKPPILIVPPKN